MELNAHSVVENWRSLPIVAWDNGAHFIDWRLVVTITVPAVVVVLGWFLGHWLNARRDLILRKRETRLKALEAAYMRLATSNNRELTEKQKSEIEVFVSELQLYGTPRQIRLMTEVVIGFGTKDSVSFDEILMDLRNTIRKELHLEPVSGRVLWLRFLPNDKPPETIVGAMHN